MSADPYLITLKKHIAKAGCLTSIEQTNELPINIKRVYWIYDLEEEAERGNHANLNSDRIIVCIHGSASIKLESQAGKKTFAFELTAPNHALFFPRNHWISMKASKGSIVLCLASTLYHEDHFEKDYAKFRRQVLA